MKLVLIHPDKGGYWAEVSDRPGCLSQGATLAETIANIEEAYRGHRWHETDNSGFDQYSIVLMDFVT